MLDEKALIALTRNDYEPDISFFNAAKASQLTPDQLRFPAPELIVEVVSDTTEQCDRGVKFRDYAAHSLAEYWLVDLETEVIEQYENADGRYKLRLKLDNGTLASRVVQGLESPVRTVFDAEENLAALRRLLT